MNTPRAESNGRVEGALPRDYHLSMVSKLVGHSIPQQEGLARGENTLLASRRLLSRI